MSEANILRKLRGATRLGDFISLLRECQPNKKADRKAFLRHEVEHLIKDDSFF